MQYSSFTKRLIAAIFDMAVLNTFVVFFGDLALSLSGNRMPDEEVQVALDAAGMGGNLAIPDVNTIIIMGIVYSVLSVAAVIIVDAVMPATSWMGSPGKRLLGMVIVDKDGKRLTYGKAFGRHAAKFVSGLSLFGFFTPIWDEKKRSLHDKMVGTFVVNRKGLEMLT